MRAGRYKKGMRVEISAKGLGISEEAGHRGDITRVMRGERRRLNLEKRK